MMKTTITDRDIENPQRFIAEGLGAPECVVCEAKVQESTGYLHDGIYSGK